MTIREQAIELLESRGYVKGDTGNSWVAGKYTVRLYTCDYAIYYMGSLQCKGDQLELIKQFEKAN